MSFYDELLQNAPDFPSRLAALPQNAAAKIRRKLGRETKDKLNFYSILSEVKFGEFLQKLSLSPEYDKSLEGRTPDWYFTYGDECCIVEVRRINPAMPESVMELVYDYVDNRYAAVIPPSLISAQSEILRPELFGDNHMAILSSFEEQLEVYSNEIIAFLQQSSVNNLALRLDNTHGVSCVTLTLKRMPFELWPRKKLIGLRGPDSIKWQIEKATYVLANKATTYVELIRKTRCKYLIALDLPMDTAVRPEEIYSELVDASVYFRNDSAKRQERRLGLFHTYEDFYSVDGVLIYYNSSVYFVKNPSKDATTPLLAMLESSTMAAYLPSA